MEAVIAVGFRTNSERAIVFRQLATSVLKDFSIRGYVLDKESLKNGTFLNEDYFDHLMEQQKRLLNMIISKSLLTRIEVLNL